MNPTLVSGLVGVPEAMYYINRGRDFDMQVPERMPTSKQPLVISRILYSIWTHICIRPFTRLIYVYVDIHADDYRLF